MLTINVCVGTSCHVKGAYNVIDGLQTIIKKNNVGNKVNVNGAFCLGECTKPVSVRINNNAEVYSVSESNLEDFFEKTILPLLNNLEFRIEN